MRKVFLFTLLFVLVYSAQGQPPEVYTIKADSTKLTGCDSNELIIENHTQAVKGFLYNTGNGRTIFKKGIEKLGDSAYLIGGDTLRAWVQGGNKWGKTGVFGTFDNDPIDFYSNSLQRARLTTGGSLILGNNLASSIYMLDAFGTGRFQNQLTVTSTQPANLGELKITANTTAVGNSADFTIGQQSGSRLYMNNYQTIFQNNVTSSSLTTNQIYCAGPFTFLGQGYISSGGNNTDNYIYMSVNNVQKKAAIIQKGGYSYGVMDMKFAFNANGDTSTVTEADTKVTFKANGNVLIGPGSLGLGTTSPSTQLHTTGGVRFAGLTNDNTQTRVVVADANGNLYYRTLSTWTANEAVRSSLAVNGPIKAKALILEGTEGKAWPDYVFDSAYKLPDLNEVAAFVRTHRHLPGIASADDQATKGIDIGENQAAMLKKIEELTLYTIQQKNEMDELKGQNAKLTQQVDQINKQLEELKRLVLKSR